MKTGKSARRSSASIVKLSIAGTGGPAAFFSGIDLQRFCPYSLAPKSQNAQEGGKALRCGLSIAPLPPLFPASSEWNRLFTFDEFRALFVEDQRVRQSPDHDNDTGGAKS